jgi:hypothetical protein
MSREIGLLSETMTQAEGIIFGDVFGDEPLSDEEVAEARKVTDKMHALLRDGRVAKERQMEIMAKLQRVEEVIKSRDRAELFRLLGVEE